MKKVHFYLEITLLALFACACGQTVKYIDKTAVISSETSENPEESLSDVDGKKELHGEETKNSSDVDAYVFEAVSTSGDNIPIAVGTLIQPVLSALGEPSEYFEAASCAFDGLDKMYTYPHYEIDTYPAADGDRISAIYLTDDLVSTKEGLSIGDSKEKMETLYGTEHSVNGTEYIYKKGDMRLKIQITGDRVFFITYALKIIDTTVDN